VDSQGKMERGEFISELEVAIKMLTQMMTRLGSTDKSDEKLFEETLEKWKEAQVLWLQAARGMSPEKANATLKGLPMRKEFVQWRKHGMIGNPPTVLDLFDGPLSDEEFGRLQERKSSDSTGLAWYRRILDERLGGLD